MLKDKIKEDITLALKTKKEVELSALRLLLAAVNTRETEKRTRIWKEKPNLSPETLEKEGQLLDDEILQVVSSEIKKRREAVLGFEQGGRRDAADKEKKEMEILQQYLPAQLSEQEIKTIVQEAIKKTGAVNIKEMGKVMAQITPQLKGKAEMGQVSKIVKEQLS